MKKIIAILTAAILLTGAAAYGESYAISKANISNFRALLKNMQTAYANPSSANAGAIRENITAIVGQNESDGEVATSIAECWEKVYLDPDYPLYLYTGGDRAETLEQTAIPDSADHAFVVLGYELKNGEMTDELKGRCDAAAAAANSFPNTILVCSGGATGKNNPERHTEAGLMKAYLTEQCGIDPNRIFVDEKAMDTVDNAVNTFAILQKQGVRTMTIVTSSYHQRRGQVIYNAVAALYRQLYGYSPEIAENYCLDIEPANEKLRNDASTAISQLSAILGLSGIQK